MEHTEEERQAAAGRLFALFVSLGEYDGADRVLRELWED